MNNSTFDKTLIRLASEIIERHNQYDKLYLIGIRTRGDVLAKRIQKIIYNKFKLKIGLGVLDVTFYRDDFRKHSISPVVGPSDITFVVEQSNIIIIDDVLFTGRTIRAAMDEIFTFGRPNKIELCVFADRGHRELPISPDYIGKNFPTSLDEHIHVNVKEIDNEDSIILKKK